MLFRSKPWHRVLFKGLDPTSLQKYLAWRPVDIIKKTLEHTTQLATSNLRYPMRRHFKSRNPFANVHRLEETVSTDPIFANCKSMDNQYIGAQIYYGLKSKHIDVYGIKSKGEFPNTYRDFIRVLVLYAVIMLRKRRVLRSWTSNASLPSRINGLKHITSIRIL